MKQALGAQCGSNNLSRSEFDAQHEASLASGMPNYLTAEIVASPIDQY